MADRPAIPFPRATERSIIRTDRRSVRRDDDVATIQPNRDAIDAPTGPRTWTFLTNHAHVLIAISRNPELRQRDISRLVGITEGAVQRIVAELEDDGYLRRERIGRRNRYHVDADRPLRHPLEREHTIDDILRTVNQPA